MVKHALGRSDLGTLLHMGWRALIRSPILLKVNCMKVLKETYTLMSNLVNHFISSFYAAAEDKSKSGVGL